MNTLTILNQSVRTSGNLFSLNDLHKAAGKESKHQPNRFLRANTTLALIDEISQYPDLGNALRTNHGGANPGTWVCKELVYAYAMWISAKFHLQVIRAFDSLACQSLTLTSEQKLNIRKAVGIKAKNDGESHKRIYSAIYNHFSISEYGDLLQEQYEEAIEFIQSLNITPRLPQSSQVPFYSTRVMLVIENGPDGQKVSQSPVPDDAFVVSKARIANLLNDPSLFTFDEMVQIAQVAQSRMVSLAKALPQALPNRD